MRTRMGTDKDRGVIDLRELLPEEGMAVTIINRGDHWQLVHHFLPEYPGIPVLELTDADVEAMKRGEITFQ